MSQRRITILKQKRLAPTGFELTFSSARTPWSGFLVEEHLSPETGSENKWQYLKPHVVLHTQGRSNFRYCENREHHNIVLEPDTVAILPEGYEMSFTWTGAVSFLVVELDKQIVDRLFPAGDFPLSRALVPNKLIMDPQLVSLMRSIERETKEGSPSGRLYGESLSMALSAYVMNRFSAETLTATTPEPLFKLSRAQTRMVAEYIHGNLDQDLGVGELSAMLRLSPYYFCRLFRSTFGVSPHQYVTDARICKAKKLLEDVRLDIPEIAMSVGYATQSHFTSVFHRHTGTTPRRFRLQG